LILFFFGSLLGSEPSFCRSRSERADAQTRDEPAFSIAFRNRRLLRVVTTRNHIHWLVTENGAVDLYGKTLQERARLVISIAHPSAQEELDRAAFERFGSHHHYIKGYMQK